CRFKSLKEGVHSHPSGVLDCQVPELLGDLAESGHPVVECIVSEKDLSRLQDVHVVLEEPLFIDVRFVDLALRAIFPDEPVVTKRLRIPLPGNPYELGGLSLEPLQLAGTDLQVSVQFEMAHDASLALSSTDVSDFQTVLGMRLLRIIRMTLWPKSAVGSNISGQPPSITVIPCFRP